MSRNEPDPIRDAVVEGARRAWKQHNAPTAGWPNRCPDCGCSNDRHAVTGECLDCNLCSDPETDD